MNALLKPIDNYLNNYTMYRVVLNGLFVLVAVSFLLSFAGILYYTPLQLLSSLLILTVVCFTSNILFAKLVGATTNIESSSITALILFFIFLPVASFNDAYTIAAAGGIAMASKYILAINNKHIFNPAAIAAFIMGLLGNGDAIWWAGSDILLPFVLIIGLLIVRKIRRFRLFFSFLFASLATIGVFQTINQIPLTQALPEAFVSWPIIFFGTIMLTEPLTTPPTKRLQMIYGVLVGILFGSQFEFGPIYSTPEFALIAGNIYSFFVSPQVKLLLTFKERRQAAANTFEFIFASNKKLHFKPGQYLEWTVPAQRTDDRGNRRYFTIASSPTEEGIKLGVRMEEKSSTFKKILGEMKQGKAIVASQLTGDFTMPDDVQKKLVFIAGGIGITPFRSMIKYLTDKNEKRDIVLFYANKTEDEIAYRDIFEAAQNTIGLKPVYILSDKTKIPAKWSGKIGRIDETMIREIVPDYKERIFYISGPNAMVDAYKQLLRNIGIPHGNIITDYFPGF